MYIYFFFPPHAQSAVSLVQLRVKVKAIDCASTGGTFPGNSCTPAIIVDALIDADRFGPSLSQIRPDRPE